MSSSTRNRKIHISPDAELDQVLVEGMHQLRRVITLSIEGVASGLAFDLGDPVLDDYVSTYPQRFVYGYRADRADLVDGALCAGVLIGGITATMHAGPALIWVERPSVSCRVLNDFEKDTRQLEWNARCRIAWGTKR